MYGLIKVAATSNLNIKCYNEMQYIYDAIHRKEIWAIKGSYPPPGTPESIETNYVIQIRLQF